MAACGRREAYLDYDKLLAPRDSVMDSVLGGSFAGRPAAHHSTRLDPFAGVHVARESPVIHNSGGQHAVSHTQVTDIDSSAARPRPPRKVAHCDLRVCQT